MKERFVVSTSTKHGGDIEIIYDGDSLSQLEEAIRDHYIQHFELPKDRRRAGERHFYAIYSYKFEPDSVETRYRRYTYNGKNLSYWGGHGRRNKLDKLDILILSEELNKLHKPTHS